MQCWWWRDHCESSTGSHDERRPSATWSPTLKPSHCGPVSLYAAHQRYWLIGWFDLAAESWIITTQYRIKNTKSRQYQTSVTPSVCVLYLIQSLKIPNKCTIHNDSSSTGIKDLRNVSFLIGNDVNVFAWRSLQFNLFSQFSIIAIAIKI